MADSGYSYDTLVASLSALGTTSGALISLSVTGKDSEIIPLVDYGDFSQHVFFSDAIRKFNTSLTNIIAAYPIGISGTDISSLSAENIYKVDDFKKKSTGFDLWLLNKLGVTIILTTHYLQEAEKMCDRIGILSKGSLVALDSTRNILSRIQTKKVIFKINSPIDLKNDSLKSLKIIYNNKNEVCVSYEKNAVTMNELIEIFHKANIKIIDISSDDGDLEDVFINITKN